MLQFVTKKEYWDLIDSGIVDNAKTNPKYFWHLNAIRNAIRNRTNGFWNLKSIQDAIILKYINKYVGVSIAEIGGGNSRVLPAIVKKNICFNIDEFKGVGNGPRKKGHLKGVTNISASVGDFSDSVKDEQFDVIYSISVVEHITDKKLDDFFKDCYRILKPSGLMIHLIDVYLEDATGNNSYAHSRVRGYRSFLNNKLFVPLSEPIIKTENDVCFSTSFATNPDNVMKKWNRTAPQLKNKREKSQSCTLLMTGRKVAGPEKADNHKTHATMQIE